MAAYSFGIEFGDVSAPHLPYI